MEERINGQPTPSPAPLSCTPFGTTLPAGLPHCAAPLGPEGGLERSDPALFTYEGILGRGWVRCSPTPPAALYAVQSCLYQSLRDHSALVHGLPQGSISDARVTAHEDTGKEEVAFGLHGMRSRAAPAAFLVLRALTLFGGRVALSTNGERVYLVHSSHDGVYRQALDDILHAAPRSPAREGAMALALRHYAKTASKWRLTMEAGGDGAFRQREYALLLRGCFTLFDKGRSARPASLATRSR